MDELSFFILIRRLRRHLPLSWGRLKEGVKFISDAKTLNEEIELFWLDE